MASSTLEALTYVSSLVEAFQAFDSDNNGMINCAELQALMSSLGHQTTIQEAKDIITLSGSQNNQVNIKDFLGTMNANELGLGGLGDLFQAMIPALGQAAEFDSLIDGEELAKMMSLVGTVSVEDCMEIVSCLDCDDDGVINIEEIKLIASLL